jgi:hypothetical protein
MRKITKRYIDSQIESQKIKCLLEMLLLVQISLQAMKRIFFVLGDKGGYVGAHATMPVVFIHCPYSNPYPPQMGRV